MRWTAQDDTHITAHYQVDGTPVDVHRTLDHDGAIRSLAFNRWGDPDKTGQWGWHPFGGEITRQRTFGGRRPNNSQQRTTRMALRDRSMA